MVLFSHGISQPLFKAAQGPLHIKVETVGRGSWPCMVAAWTVFVAGLSIAMMFPTEEFISLAQVPRLTQGLRQCRSGEH
jgi:fucose permease